MIILQILRVVRAKGCGQQRIAYHLEFRVVG